MKAFQHPVLLRPAKLAVLQHHFVQSVLGARIGRQRGHRGQGHAPPSGWRQRTKIKSPGALALGQAIAEHVIVRMADQPFGNHPQNLSPILVGTRRPGIVRPRHARRRRGVHDLPEPKRPPVRINGEQRMEQRRPGARLAGRKKRPLDLLVGNRMELEFLEELQSRSQQPVTHIHRRALAPLIHPQRPNVSDRHPESRGQRVIAIVAEAGRGLRNREHRISVQDIRQLSSWSPHAYVTGRPVWPRCSRRCSRRQCSALRPHNRGRRKRPCSSRRHITPQ